jgi:fumarate reductase flavoprotein subunit
VEDGRITAILADSPEGEVRIACKACILATGSWINNAELMAQICPQFLEAKKHMDPSPHTNPNYTGDGFAIAQAVDAKLDKENYVLRLMGPMVFSKSGVLSNMGNSPFTLAINTQGKRYVCEPSQIRNGVFNSGLMMMEQPQGYVYILFDSNNLAAALKDAQENPKPPAPGVFGLPPLPDTLEGALEELEQALAQEQGVFRGDTPAELAEKMGVPVQALEETVEKYNRYCAEGFDRTCFKQREYLVPCDQAPYYAVRAKLGTDGAFGGVLVNGRMQAYRADGSVIPGLYVTGDFASGRFLNMAGAKVQVLNDMSWALSSGFLAGTNVCEEL